MTGSRPRLATALLALVGVCLVVAAFAGGRPGAPATEERGREVPGQGAAPRLGTSVPREPGAQSSAGPSTGPTTGPTAGAADGEPPAPARVGEPLPPQWPEFRPTRVVLRPDAGGGAAAVDPVSVVDGSLELPDDADRVGWWRGGSAAGAPFGTVVVAGHLDSDTDPAGYLAGLAALGRGDLVELASGAERQRYRVVGNHLLPSADLSSRSDLFAQRRSHRLVLITCGGPYDERRGRYRDNRVVEAVPVAS